MASRERIGRDLRMQLQIALEQGDFEKAQRLTGFIQELEGGALAMPPDAGNGMERPHPLLPQHEAGHVPPAMALDLASVPLPPRRPSRSVPDFIYPTTPEEEMPMIAFGNQELTGSEGAYLRNGLQTPPASHFTAPPPGQQPPYTVDMIEVQANRRPQGAHILEKAVENAGEWDRGFPDRFRAEIDRIADSPELFGDLHPSFQRLVTQYRNGAAVERVLRAFGEYRLDGEMSVVSSLADNTTSALVAAGMLTPGVGKAMALTALASTAIGEGAHGIRMAESRRRANLFRALLELSPEELAVFEETMLARMRMHPRRASRQPPPISVIETIKMSRRPNA